MEWELGADARFNEGETRERFRNLGAGFTRSRVAGGENSVAGLYAEGSWSSGPWLAAGGVRYDAWSNSEGRRLERDLATGLPTLDEADPDRSGEVVSARLALRREIGGGQAVRLAAYSGFRPATLN
ncbi:MAG: TonB-dependent receptor, partial [Brevundimonas sp.]|uniref:TonB-dependent receptor domain-containing protein n=1 Tax=Brevundimonas sp. TaxID=1871086 RepID=UPI002ABD0EB7|nr:TonB-dependent receptor [Brevundimonas sp.]